MSSVSLYESILTWPFEEARKILQRESIGNPITLSTGYGPSGLPHIGTFGEVVRTSMVRHALGVLQNRPTQLLCFSDDMDGLRKVPDNIPNPDVLASALNLPLTKVPDPFGTHSSFGHHNNHLLQCFLDALHLDYTFVSATQCYESGLFDAMLQKVLDRHEAILDIMLPTLGPERQATYSPFLPLSPKTGRVLQVKIHQYNRDTIVYQDEDGHWVETPVTGGACKLQWKVDWGMRWVALGVDYEMCGKDLIDSYRLAAQICKVLGGVPPVNLIYEHFLDENGGKISKSKGNGISVEEWLRYAPVSSLAYYMFPNPQRAKRLYFDIIPRSVDEYEQHLRAYVTTPPEQQPANPVWSIHQGHPPTPLPSDVSFSLLLNLACACQAENSDILWRLVQRVAPQLSKEQSQRLSELMDKAVVYYLERVKPYKTHKTPTDHEAAALRSLASAIQADPLASAQELQNHAYTIGKEYFEDLKQWFSAIYEILLGQSSGPRVGTFISVYGVQATIDLINAHTAKSTT